MGELCKSSQISLVFEYIYIYKADPRIARSVNWVP